VRRDCSIPAIQGFPNPARQILPLSGFSDELQARVEDEAGVGGIYAVAAGNQHTDFGALDSNLLEDNATAELGHHHVEQGQIEHLDAARHPQHRSRQSIHQRVLDENTAGFGRENQHGWSRALFRQHLYRRALAHREIEDT
jgi:hypothetical protein